MPQITPSEIEALIQAWKNRARAQGYQPKSKLYARLETEFFAGVIACLLTLGRTHPTAWELLILRGRSISGTPDPQNLNPPTTEKKD